MAQPASFATFNKLHLAIMNSQFSSFAVPRWVTCRYISRVVLWVALGTVSTGLSLGNATQVSAQGSDTTTSTTKSALLQAFPRQQTASLGSPVSTNLVGYRVYCSNPQDVSQITALCVFLGVLTGGNTDGSVEFENLTEGLPATSEPVNPDEMTSTPKPYPLGAVSQEQNDRMQLFSSPQ